MSVGIQVKIVDIGPLATVVQLGRNMVKIELMGGFGLRRSCWKCRGLVMMND